MIIIASYGIIFITQLFVLSRSFDFKRRESLKSDYLNRDFLFPSIRDGILGYCKAKILKGAKKIATQYISSIMVFNNKKIGDVNIN